MSVNMAELIIWQKDTLNLPPDRCAVDIGVSCELGDGAKAGDAAIWLLRYRTFRSESEVPQSCWYLCFPDSFPKHKSLYRSSTTFRPQLDYTVRCLYSHL
jgi:hypothetical protein